MIREVQHYIALFNYVHNATWLFEQGMYERFGPGLDILKNVLGEIHERLEVVNATARNQIAFIG